MIFYTKLSSFAEEKSFLIKAIFISLMGFVAFFIDKDNPWLHWTWILYFALTIALLLHEYHDDQTKRQSPLIRIKRYLGDFEGWRQSAGHGYTRYYEPSPEYTIRYHEGESSLDFQQEWTRGEIGSFYNSGNAAYYDDMYLNDILLKRIHIVIFDGGKKTIVAPDWQEIAGGRFYYYLQDSIEYRYQKLLSHGMCNDYSKSIRKIGASEVFDIPLFRNKEHLKEFRTYCDSQAEVPTLTDRSNQDIIFSNLLNKYTLFQQI